LERFVTTRRDALLVFGGVFASSLGPVGTATAAIPAGVVTSLVGNGQLTAANGQRALAVGALVSVGDVVQTMKESRVGLALGKTVLRLGPDSSLRVEKHLIEAGEEIELLGGNMYFEHTASSPRKATVRSPYGLIAVRGTKFFAGTSAKGFGVFVAEGQVDVTGAGKIVRLTRGLGTDIARPGRPPSAPRVWGAPRVRETTMLTFGTPRLPR
jgi:ferric-dicitrate binding protein FerR (iron transport regulator)